MAVHELSIVTVNYNAYDFLHLLAESLDKFASVPCQLIVVDNSDQPINPEIEGALYAPMGCNLGHGAGLIRGAQLATSPFTMFVDVDCHFISRGWEEKAFGLLETHDVLAGRGVPQKPIRPACMIMRTKVAQKYDWRDTPGYKGHRVTPEGFDVAIKAYHQMVADGVPILMLDSQQNHYGTLNGECWTIDGVPFLYHHWHGTHLDHRQVDFPNDNLAADKSKLFRSIPWRIADNLL